ncbi:hypothetical protein TIFTF001_009479 [Ficus carica]|uniref:Uncharacterized protein n=1 Tax=Ficus carica TaxID=3494 RepID=A0AA87ZUQ3_FICCA|nr:hypothetical protein TIFTF001_009479 [Ficus carica]
MEKVRWSPQFQYVGFRGKEEREDAVNFCPHWHLAPACTQLRRRRRRGKGTVKSVTVVVMAVSLVSFHGSHAFRCTLSSSSSASSSLVFDSSEDSSSSLLSVTLFY